MAAQLRTCRRKGQRRPSLIFMLGKSLIWPSSMYSGRNRIGEHKSWNRPFTDFCAFAAQKPPSFLFFLPLSVPSSLTSPIVIPARRASETHLNSFRFTSSFRFFRQIFTDLGFFVCRRPRNGRFLFSSVRTARYALSSISVVFARLSHYVSIRVIPNKINRHGHVASSYMLQSTLCRYNL